MKLLPGLAELYHRQGDRYAWVDAITDEVARETGKFVGWEGGTNNLTIYVRSKRGDVAIGRLALYCDALGRKWRQREFRERGMGRVMIVKVELPEDGTPQTSAFISNEDKSLQTYTGLTAPLIARMMGKKKRYFHASLTSGVIEIEDAAKDQPW